jgi:hypothetical protein
MTRIEGLKKSDVWKKLGDYLSLAQLEGLMKRRQLLLDHATALSKSQGERAVYYP